MRELCGRRWLVALVFSLACADGGGNATTPAPSSLPRPTPPRPTPPRPTPPRPTRAPSVRAAAPPPPPPGGFVVTLPGIAAIIGLCFVVAFGASAVAFRYFGGRGKEPAQQYELVSRDDYVDFDNGPRDSFNPFGR